MREFQPGASHPDIELIQLALQRAGYDAGVLDGIFGQKTKRALDRFRQDRDTTIVADIVAADWRALAPFFVGYVRHTVVAGDTLTDLATRHRAELGAILTANPGLVADHLTVGQQLVVPLDFSIVPTGIRMTSRVVSYVVRGLLARYPAIRARVIGQSVAEKPIFSLVFGAGENEVCYNAAHHGNEWITTPVLLQFLETYASAVARGGTIAGQDAVTLHAMSRLHLIPLVSPDGVDIATGFEDRGAVHDHAVYLARHYPHIPFPRGWKANARGVDLNLQYPAGWETAQEIKFGKGFTLPGPRDYVGPSALSEPEAQAMHRYTLEHDFALTLSYHSQGEVIYWQYLDYLPEHSREIGLAFSRLSGYALEETPFASGHAGYKDWFIQQFDRPSYTIEVGLGESPLPLAQFDKIYADNEAMLATALVITA